MTAAPKVRLPIGIDDFAKLREFGAYYVDKMRFIREVIDAGAEALLFPRPRRFGKSLALSALGCFLDRRHAHKSPELFAGLEISADTEFCRKHQGHYPVLSLSLKEVKASTFDDFLATMRDLMSRVALENSELLESKQLHPLHRAQLDDILYKRSGNVELASSMALITRCLHAQYGERVILLIDEYDTPLHTAYLNGYFDQASAFFRPFLGAALKGNASLHKGVLTGILRVAKESIFSDLNNIQVHSLLSPQFSTAYGFTPEEVERLATDCGQGGSLPGIEQWYNGYRFGNQVIYNPWSVLNYVANPEGGFQPFWSNSSSNDLVRQLLFLQGHGFRGELESLVSGGTIDKRIDENVVLRDMANKPEIIWSFLLFCGYLKANRTWQNASGAWWGELSIPNREVRTTLEQMATDYIDTRLRGDAIERLFKAMFEGDADTLEAEIERYMLASISFHDIPDLEPERVYHAFVLGLLVQLQEDYEVKSNRESGYGRCDMTVIPRNPDKPGARIGVIIEFKTVNARKKETMKRALKAAEEQILNKGYIEELRSRGVTEFHAYACAFSGKRVEVRRLTASSSPPR